MMAGIFAVFTLALVSVISGERKVAIVIMAFGLLASLLLFWYLATDTLKL
jgi:hypothetical protein